MFGIKYLRLETHQKKGCGNKRESEGKLKEHLTQEQSEKEVEIVSKEQNIKR